jgi:drug/metabolite transporter (DMT)-like permease
MKNQISNTWTKYRTFLAILLIVSGTINAISVKWMNTTEAKGLKGIQIFAHPFFQSDLMYLGELLCLLAFYIAFKVLTKKQNGVENEHKLTKGTRKFNRFIWWQASILDLIATVAMYIGLTMTNASTFHMLRGLVIIFTAGFSKRRIIKSQWIAIVLIIVGLVIIGLADVSEATDEKAVVTYAFEEGNPFEIMFNRNFQIFIPRASAVANR